MNRAWGYCHGGTIKIEKCAGSKQTLTQTIREKLSSGLRQPIQNPADATSVTTMLLSFGTEHVSTYVYMYTYKTPVSLTTQ